MNNYYPETNKKMFYYVRYSLRYNGIHETNAPVQSVRTIFKGAYDAFDPNGDSIQSAYWPSHEEALKKASIKYPDGVFILKGEGDDSLDIWVKYFKNGKMKKDNAIVTFPKFNEVELA